MSNQNLVWYASYGSNVNRDRFHLYIKGGRLPGKDRIYAGCRNKNLPLAEQNLIVNYELYFAKRAVETWNGCGVGFIKTESNKNTSTYCKMYLITEEQFVDVVKQESNTTDNIEINFNQAIANGSLIFRPNSWYGNLIFLGTFDHKPAFTFTNENNTQVARRPDGGYLKEISKGLKQSFQLTDQSIVEYFISKEGVISNYTRDQLLEIIKD